MASLSSEKKAQLKKLQSALKKTTEQYQITEKNIGKLITLLNETRDQLDLPPRSKKNRSKIQKAREQIPIIESKLDYQREAGNKFHEQIIALRSSIEKLSSSSNVISSDIAQGPERDPQASEKRVKINVAEDKIIQLKAAIKKQSGIVKRENELLDHFKGQKTQFEQKMKEYEPDSDEYAFELSNVKDAEEAITGQGVLVIKEENKLNKLQDGLKNQQQIIKDLS